jgi:hypothetical protein
MALNSFLHNMDVLLDERFVFIHAREVESRSAWKLKKELFEWGEFAICSHGHDLETALQGIIKNGLELFEDCFNFAIAEMRHCSEAYLAAQRDEEWYFVHKKYVDRHHD